MEYLSFAKFAFLGIVLFAIFSAAQSYNSKDLEAQPVYGHVDAVPAGTGYHHSPKVKGRVQIKVYRGPSKGHGYHKFAPWGYWVKQPEDDKGYGHHGGGYGH